MTVVEIVAKVIYMTATTFNGEAKHKVSLNLKI